MTTPRLARWKTQLVTAGRERTRRAFFRSRVLRQALVLALWPRLRRQSFDLAHLSFYLEEEAIGPVQRDEALLLPALTRVALPRIIVEVSFLGGMSSLNFLLAMDSSAKLYAFDISTESERFARTHFRGQSSFLFRRKSQDEITAADVDFRSVDLVFLDASHELALNSARSSASTSYWPRTASSSSTTPGPGTGTASQPAISRSFGDSQTTGPATRSTSTSRRSGSS